MTNNLHLILSNIKAKLVELAANDDLPMDMNEFDQSQLEGCFDGVTIFVAPSAIAFMASSTVIPVVNVQSDATIGVFSQAEKEILVDEDVIFFDGGKWLTDDEPLLWETLLREYAPHIKGEDPSIAVYQENHCPNNFWREDIIIGGRELSYRQYSPPHKGDKISFGFYLHPIGE